MQGLHEEDVTEFTQALIPIDQFKQYEIASEIEETEFHKIDKFGKRCCGRIGKKLENLAAKFRRNNTNKTGMITFRQYISIQKSTNKRLVRL